MKQKIAIVDPKKQAAVFRACHTDQDSTLVTVLMGTGMHISVYADPGGHDVRFDGAVLAWRRPKTRTLIQQRVTDRNLTRALDRWVHMGPWQRESRQRYWARLKAIGKRAGIPDLSPTTFRHTFCYNDLLLHRDPMRTKALMGCSANVLWRNYMLLTGPM